MDLYIKKSILHAFDPGNPDLIFSNELLDLGKPDMLTYVTKKIEKLYTDDAKRGTLSEGNAFLDKVSDDFMQTSVDVANFWAEEFRAGEDQKFNDLLIVSYELQGDMHLAFMRMSLRDAFSHEIDPEGNVQIAKRGRTLPGAGSAADEGVAINLVTRGYHLIEKRITQNGKKYNYFSENLLVDRPDISVNKAIKAIKKTAESVAKIYSDDDAFQFSSKVSNAVFNQIEDKNYVDPETLSDIFFPDSLTAKQEFVESVKEIVPDVVHFDQVSPERIEKKLSNQKLSLSNGIELTVPQSLYDDAESVEFILNQDGTYSILIKNIEEIKNKW
jgi:hypothetical protein